jgi:hypothetical protein
MFGVNARGVIAVMETKEAFRDRTNEFAIRDTVNEIIDLAAADLTVALRME